MTDTSKKIFYKNQAQTIIKNMEKRKMAGYYCDSLDEAENLVLKLIGEGKKSVAYGGTMTVDNSDLKEMIVKAGHDLILREKYNTPELQKELKAKMTNADTFLMSTNAITLDGELVNIDGAGSRVSYLIYGPEQVIIIAGMNKVVPTVEEGISRTRNIASPANTVRLHCETPCSVSGRCGDCYKNTICCQFVITRASRIQDRIKVILVGEELGY